MLAYHFLETEWAIDDIKKKRLKVSRFEDLNDPFEVLGVDINDRALRKTFRSEKSRQNRTKGLVCFSSEWSNTLMWSHYAEKHGGICLGFDVPDEKLVPVRYRKAPLQAAVLATESLGTRLVAELLRTKYSGWSYENEHRLFVDLKAATVEGGRHYIPFSADLSLRKVILGHHCNLGVAEARQLVSKMRDVEVIKARLAFRSFKVRPNLTQTNRR